MAGSIVQLRRVVKIPRIKFNKFHKFFFDLYAQYATAKPK